MTDDKVCEKSNLLTSKLSCICSNLWLAFGLSWCSAHSIFFDFTLSSLDFLWFYQASFFKNGINDMAGRTLRCVALAFRTYEAEKVPTGEELSKWVLPEDDLILLAIVGIKVRIDLVCSFMYILAFCFSFIVSLVLWDHFQFTVSHCIVLHYRHIFLIDQTLTRMSCPAIFLVYFFIEMFEMCTGSM